MMHYNGVPFLIVNTYRMEIYKSKLWQGGWSATVCRPRDQYSHFQRFQRHIYAGKVISTICQKDICLPLTLVHARASIVNTV